MMAVPMDKATASLSPRELAQRLLKKNAEHDSRLRRAAQSKIPSDPSIWLQMRENYEKIILADPEFSENHEIEYHLWQLHYKRIEEFRGHINSAAASSSAAVQGGKNNVNPDRVKRIKSTFRSFLSEATGFYHDLMLKIRSNHGLPLGYFPEGLDTSVVPGKDKKKIIDMKKGLMSCYRCLIYLGDLARYKGLYGDADSASREYSAASSYYKEAASLCPSNGNPHHQLAILASYSGDEVTAIYRYFRSLAMDSPFSTARENLIIAFEKNRQSYAQLHSKNKVAAARALPSRSVGRGRGRADTRIQPKGANTEVTSKEQEYSIPDILQSFFVRFVRLNGILFTKTSLETFGELSATVASDLQILLSSGPVEELNFGSDAVENALSFVKLIAILVFTVYNVNKDSENPSYAETAKRRVLLQNAYSTTFEFVGYLLKRCLELHDVSSSTYLPAILVFIEWLACHPDYVSSSEMEQKQADARTFFWNQCVAFMNKLILTGLARVDGDDDETCFSDMCTYEEGETGNRIALWEDVELRGFLPLAPAQVILDFSNKHASGADGSTKEKQARVQRILAAGKALMSFVQIDQLRIYFEPTSKKFLMSTEPPVSKAPLAQSGSSHADETNPTEYEHQVTSNVGSVAEKLDVVQTKAQLCAEGDDDEEIVFKPPVSEKPLRGPSELGTNEFIQPVQTSDANWLNNGTPVSLQSTTSASTASTYVQSLPMSSIGWAVNGGPQLIPSVAPRSSQPFNMSDPTWVSTGAPLVAPQSAVPMPSFPSIVPDHYTPASSVPSFSSLDNPHMLPQNSFLLSALKNVNIGANGFLDHRVNGGLNGLQYMGNVPHVSAGVPWNGPIPNLNQFKSTEVTIPSAFDSVLPSVASMDGTTTKFMDTQVAISRKSPVSRPGRHVGPPPGFNNVPSKRRDDFISVGNGHHVQADDIWLNGYRPSLDLVNNQRHAHSNVTTSNSALTTPFPFPGKQAFGMYAGQTNEKQWHDFQLFESTKQLPEHSFPQGHQNNGPLAESQPAQSIWSGRYPV
ncbi:protein SMG7 [Brachypodium distachyon]|uniref:DNA/RNA-binding domain-containing protein n=1 Tax=Brachypodium distachyon TaxID=15368 RepID=I1I2R2_BRADI|nr:protein SMG7 [Brachypodium distachyon]XP_014756550.1 protein SMG7 [Brachypodium distachyon]KQJ96008.1 hypothetical protein BRADI_3g20200v3 [Brachypodium distachyon]|eukprot:XP_010234570.1 protein SMG7 [Brachypodium distachyon]